MMLFRENGDPTLPTGDALPTAADVAALPTPEALAAMPAARRAAAVGLAAATVGAYIDRVLYPRRRAAALTLHLRHHWQPSAVYVPLPGVKRRNFTKWKQDAAGLTLSDLADAAGLTRPNPPAGQALRVLEETHAEIVRLLPLRAQYIRVRGETWQELAAEGRDGPQIRKLMGLGRGTADAAQREAAAAGVTTAPAPAPVTVPRRVETHVREQLAAAAPGFVDQLPTEHELARALTGQWGVAVHRSAVTDVYGRLRAEGLLVSRPREGWYVAGSPAADGVPLAAVGDDVPAGPARAHLRDLAQRVGGPRVPAAVAALAGVPKKVVDGVARHGGPTAREWVAPEVDAALRAVTAAQVLAWVEADGAAQAAERAQAAACV